VIRELNWKMFCLAQKHQPWLRRTVARVLFRYITRPLKDWLDA